MRIGGDLAAAQEKAWWKQLIGGIGLRSMASSEFALPLDNES